MGSKIYRSTDKSLPSLVQKYFDAIKSEQDKDPTQRGQIYRAASHTHLKAVKEYKEDEAMVINAIANKAKKDRWDETVLPSAYAKRLDVYKANPIILLQHNHNNPLGISLETTPKDDGLHCQIELGNPKAASLTDCQRMARSLVAQNILRALSIGFIPHVIEWDEDLEEIRHTDVELLEISLVSVPMQQDSLIQSVKSFFINGKSISQREKEKKMDAEVKAAFEETTKAVKATNELIQKTSEENKKLTEEKDALQKKHDALVKEHEELKKEAEELVTMLQAQGILKKEAAAA